MDSTTSAAGCQASFPNSTPPPPGDGILPLVDVARLGPVSRTLAALIDIADQDRQTTFRSLARIAVIAGLSVATVARHLVTLGAAGYVEKLGRRGRRTVTYRLIGKVGDILAKPYLPLPKPQRGLPWCPAATFAYMTRWSGNGGILSTSPRAISRAINMSIRAVKNAMKSLVAAGLISRGPAPTFWVVGGKIDRGGGADLTFAVNLNLLEPNLETTPSQQEHPKPPLPPVVQVVFARPLPAPVAAPPQGPNWLDIQPGDLATAESRRGLFHSAVGAEAIGDTPDQRVYFNACCLASRGKKNPGGHLRAMVENRWNPPANPSNNRLELQEVKRKAKISTLGHIDRSDLVDPAAAVQIVESRNGPQSQHGRIRIAAEATHALRVAANPPAMFASNVAAGRWFATEADEDLAMSRLRQRPITEPVSAALADLLRPPD